jgi:hypothetical protein
VPVLTFASTTETDSPHTMTVFRHLFHAFLRVTDPATAWRLLLLSWIAVLILIFPALMITWKMDTFNAVVWVALIPLAAHLYAFAANLPALREGHDFARIGLTLPVLSYPLGAIACLPVMPAGSAFAMPYAGIFMGMLTFGIFFTGLAPVLAIALTRTIMMRSLNRRGGFICLGMLVTGWFLSGVTGFLLGNA